MREGSRCAPSTAEALWVGVGVMRIPLPSPTVQVGPARSSRFRSRVENWREFGIYMYHWVCPCTAHVAFYYRSQPLYHYHSLRITFSLSFLLPPFRCSRLT